MDEARRLNLNHRSMQKISRSLVLALAAVGLQSLGGCRVLGSVDVSVVAWEAELIGRPGAPTGSVAALSQSGRTRTSIQISGGPQEAQEYDWRIRTGTCANPGEGLGGAASFPRLEHEPPGSTTAETIIGDAMPDVRPYNAVLVDAADQTEVACGDFERV